MAPQDHALLICDIQESFRNVIHAFPQVVNTASKVLRISQALSLPVLITTQNTARLGPTVPELPISSDHQKIVHSSDKTAFSMATPGLLIDLEKSGAKSVAIVGIEAHVCVLQTALDLRRKGYEVYVLRDGVSSVNFPEVEVALQRMRQEGVRVSTSESWAYEVMGDSKIPEFREVLKVVKDTKETTKDALQVLCKL